jgi:hypothetical protein
MAFDDCMNCAEVTVSERYNWHSTRLSRTSSLQALCERLQVLLESPLWLISDLLWQRISADTWQIDLLFHVNQQCGCLCH